MSNYSLLDVISFSPLVIKIKTLLISFRILHLYKPYAESLNDSVHYSVRNAIKSICTILEYRTILPGMKFMLHFSALSGL